MGLNRGILYQPHGKWFANHMAWSIATLRRSGSDLPVCVTRIVPDDSDDIVAMVRRIPNVTVQDVRSSDVFRGMSAYSPTCDRKLRERMLAAPPFDVTLRLDCDTLVLGDISPLFDRAEQHGVCGVLDHWKPWRQSLRQKKIPQYNGGVLCVTLNTGARLVEHFHALMREGVVGETYPTDQPILNTTMDDLGLHHDGTRLPIQYNHPAIKPDTVVYHGYSYARQNASLQAKAKAIGDSALRGVLT